MAIKVFSQDSNNRIEIPTTVQTTGSVSYPQGFGEDYQKDLGTDPDAKNVERKVINQLFFEITSLLNEIQKQGSPSWVNGLEYPKGALVYYNSSTFLSLVDNNKNIPVKGTYWKDLSLDQEIPKPSIDVLPNGLPPMRLSNEQYLQYDGFQNGGAGTVLTTLESYHKSRTKKSKCRTLQMYINNEWVTIPYA